MAYPCPVHHSHCLNLLIILSLLAMGFSYSNLFPSICQCILEAIESGRFPGDILDDIPCKFVNGTLVCEVSHLTTEIFFYETYIMNGLAHQNKW